jgi:hypothetical protein
MTELEAANKALILLGVAAISGLAENIQAARVMSGLMESTRRAVLSEFPWSFALRLGPLAPSAESAPPGWLYAFEYPAGAAALYQVYGRDYSNGKIRYITQDGLICTLEQGANAEYTAMVDLGQWPNQAAEAFANRLASDAATSLTGSPQLAMTLLQKYQLLASMAKGNSMNDEYSPQRKQTHYIDARG